jgi:hypothetical protein
MRSLVVWLLIGLAFLAGAFGMALGVVGEPDKGAVAFFTAAAFSIATIVADVWLS